MRKHKNEHVCMYIHVCVYMRTQPTHTHTLFLNAPAAKKRFNAKCVKVLESAEELLGTYIAGVQQQGGAQGGGQGKRGR